VEWIYPKSALSMEVRKLIKIEQIQLLRFVMLSCNQRLPINWKQDLRNRVVKYALKECMFIHSGELTIQDCSYVEWSTLIWIIWLC
jgi:hypothetical protein